MNKKELYHGSPIKGIKILKPAKLSIPTTMQDINKKVYAALTKAYAATHSFAWGTKEGFKLIVTDKGIKLKVPKQHEKRLKKPAYIYTINKEGFEELPIEPKGYNFATEKEVPTIKEEHYNTVKEAIEQNGGIIKIIQ
jgi:hypothetical protein